MPSQLNALCKIPRLYLAWNTVKAKGSVGGIDGISILEFEMEKRREIPKLAEELKDGTWNPQPYMEIEVAKTKNPEEMRKLGMTAIRDKIHERFGIFGSKSNLQFALSTFSFLSLQYQLKKKQYIADIIAEYVNEKQKGQQIIDAKKNRKLIQDRKKEYRKLEAETSGLLVNKPGVFLGLTSRGVTISQKGKVVAQHHPDNLSQIVITGQGVSMSSNLIGFCLNRKIPFDFFDNQGTHLGSIINSKYMQNTLWVKQSAADAMQRNTIALRGLARG